MNILLDKLPTAVKVGGKMYDINADFRTGIRLEMTAVSELDDTEKLMQILLLYYGDIAIFYSPLFIGSPNAALIAASSSPIGEPCVLPIISGTFLSDSNK